MAKCLSASTCQLRDFAKMVCPVTQDAAVGSSCDCDMVPPQTCRNGGLMRAIIATVALLLGWSAAQAQPAAPVPPAPEISKFAIKREGSQIGTVTIEVTRNGAETLVKQVTHIQVKVVLITAYRYEQSNVERWVNS